MPPSVATQLVRLALDEGLDLFHDRRQAAYASIEADDHTETWPLRSQQTRSWLARLYYLNTDNAPGSEALAAALNVLEGRARYDGSEEEVHVRLAPYHDQIFLDLGDAAWRAVAITGDGWEVVAEPPVRFRRPRGYAPLPEPAHGGTLDELRGLLNLDEKGFVLYAGCLVQALRPTGPYPVVTLTGVQGSAKTSAARVFRQVVDPNVVPLRSVYREARDVAITATHSWCVPLDNVGALPPWFSDVLCRLSTGGGFATRRLYTDQDEELFDAQRPVVLTSIEDVVTAPDLLDRAVVLHLDEIPAVRRRREDDVERALALAHPRILGALLDATATGLRRIGEVRLPLLPRMADFCSWITACEPALPWPEGTFMRAYERNQAQANQLALDAAAIGAPLMAVLDERGEYTGTAGGLLELLEARATEGQRRSRSWPRTPRGLSGRLRRLKPNLSAVGIRVEEPDPHDKARTWRLARTGTQ